MSTRLLPVEGENPKTKAAALQNHSGNRGLHEVGETGFEPATPWSRTKCSTRLSHSPYFEFQSTASHERRRESRAIRQTGGSKPACRPQDDGVACRSAKARAT